MGLHTHRPAVSHTPHPLSPWCCQHHPPLTALPAPLSPRQPQQASRPRSARGCYFKAKSTPERQQVAEGEEGTNSFPVALIPSLWFEQRRPGRFGCSPGARRPWKSSHSLGRSGCGRRRGKGKEGKGKQSKASWLPAASHGPSLSGQAGRAWQRGGTRGRGGERDSGYAPSSSPSMSKMMWVTGRSAGAGEEEEAAMARQSSGRAAGADADSARAVTGGGFWWLPGRGGPAAPLLCMDFFRQSPFLPLGLVLLQNSPSCSERLWSLPLWTY